jgi:hypothetical protein
LEDKPLWFKRTVAFTIAVVGLVAIFALPGMYVWRLATAERVTAHVESCESKPKGGYQCRGRWRMPDGRPGSGAIDGVGDEDVGKNVRVWATPGVAATNRISWLLLPALFAVSLIIAAWLVARAIQRSRRGGAAATDDSNPGEPARPPRPSRFGTYGVPLFDAPVLVLDTQGPLDYTLCDAEGRILGTAAEVEMSAWQLVRRVAASQFRNLSHRLIVSGRDKRPLLAIDKEPDRWGGLKRVPYVVTTPEGAAVGVVRPGKRLFMPDFTLLGATGEVTARVVRERPGYSYRVVDAGGETCGRLVHHSTDPELAKTDYDNPDKFTLTLEHPMREPAARLVVAALVVAHLRTVALI